MSKSSAINEREIVLKEFREYIDRFSLLDNDTLVFLQSAIGNNESAIMAINIILKARGGNHSVNLLPVEPDTPN